MNKRGHINVIRDNDELSRCEPTTSDLGGYR
jgi:hypothetical protein